MVENIVFYNPQKRDMDLTISEIFGSERESVVKKLKEMDSVHGFIPDKSCYANSYENDDYLFVADMLQDIRELHKKIYFDPQKQGWLRENRELPYIHLDFVERGSFEYDKCGNCVPNDKSLNMGVGKPNGNGSHILSFNYYWLRRYLSFLQIIFDDNEDVVVDLPDVPTQKNEKKTKQELLAVAISLQSLGLHEQAEWLKMYINSFQNDSVIAPTFTYMNIGENKNYVWGFFDESGTKFRIPMKKTIYNTSGFADLVYDRTSLVSDIFVNSLKMILAHETAHVARGHWLLRQNEPKYSQIRNVMMNCEINADWTAAYWLLNELLYDTIDGNPYSRMIAYKRSTLIYLWAVRIFAAYLSLSWFSRNEDREWTKDILKDFLEDEEATHPIYQFRLFCMLNKIKEQLDHMGKTSEQEFHFMLTVDNQPIDKSVYDGVWKKACDMIFSFEYAFRLCWNEDKREPMERIFDGLHIINSTEHRDEKVPFYMCYMQEAQKELGTYESQWSEILEKLRLYGMYFRM